MIVRYNREAAGATEAQHHLKEGSIAMEERVNALCLARCANLATRKTRQFTFCVFWKFNLFALSANTQCPKFPDNS